MSVQFEESSIQRTINSTQGLKKTGWLTKFLISKGLAKDESTANKIMIGISVVFFGLAIIFPFF